MTPEATGWRRRAGGVALAVLLAILLVDLGKLLATAVAAIGYPYDLDYGEGIVWQQMDAIVAGRGYAPLGTFPAIVFHYPPVYHLVVAGVAAATGADPLAAGRGVSLAATLAAAALVGLLALLASRRGDRLPRAVGALVAALVFATSPTVLAWAPLMRVDLLATALTLAGLAATVRTLRAPDRWPVAEAVLFALAVYAKQTAILGPLAAFAALWTVRRAAAWRFAALCGGLGLAALAILMAASDGGFLRHVVGYNVNRFDPTRWHLLARALGSQATTLALALAVVATRWRRTMRHPVGRLLAFYLALRLATLPLALKSGASDNYFIDLFSAAAVFVGVAATAVAAAVTRGGAWPRALVTLLLLAALPVQAARLGRAHEGMADPARRAAAAALVARLRADPRPTISDFMVLTRRAGRPVAFEPAIAAELGHAGLYDEAGLVRLIRARAFGLIATDERFFAERYNPAVRAAIAAAYPRVERHGEMTLHLPAAVSAGRAASPPR